MKSSDFDMSAQTHLKFTGSKLSIRTTAQTYDNCLVASVDRIIQSSHVLLCDKNRKTPVKNKRTSVHSEMTGLSTHRTLEIRADTALDKNTHAFSMSILSGTHECCATILCSTYCTGIDQKCHRNDDCTTRDHKSEERGDKNQ